MKSKVGGIVASEYHGLSSWFGETENWWIKLDRDYKTLGMHKLREHIVDAIKQEGIKPEGYLAVTAFKIN